MLYSEAKRGRTFIIRLEDGDILHEKIEEFARLKKIKAASMIVLGGADTASYLVVGPEDGRTQPIIPMVTSLRDVHEITGTGTLFPDSDGNPVLHMHIACGRKDKALAGCVRKGVKVWHVMEVILQELTDTNAKRLVDTESGFELLIP